MTPDAVELDLATATIGSRGIAYLIDAAIVLMGLLAIGIAQALLGVGGFVPGWAGLAILLICAFVLQFGYPIGFEVLWRGRTPGKAAMGLRVVTVEGLPVGIRHATVRAVVGVLELLGTLGLLAVVSSLSSSRGQRLGDLAAGTLVLRERRSGARPKAMSFPPPPGWERYVAGLDVSGLGGAERGVIRDTLRRVEELPPAARDQVIGQLSATLAPRVVPPPPQGMTAEVWIRCVAAALQRRSGGSTGPRPPRAPSMSPPSAPSMSPPPPSVPGGERSRDDTPPTDTRGFAPPD